MISNAHAGLIKAIRRCFQGAAWQRRRVHAMRNRLYAAHRRHRQVIAALIRTIFVQTPRRHRRQHPIASVVEQLRPHAPSVAERLEATETNLLAYPGSRPRTGPRSGRTTRSNASSENSLTLEAGVKRLGLSVAYF